jgi:hypothetical protein
MQKETRRARRRAFDPVGARSLVAFFLHAPGLWLLYRLRPGPHTKRENRIAIALTVALTVAVAAAAHVVTGRFIAAGLAWAAGHAFWGAWLAARVSRGLYSK